MKYLILLIFFCTALFPLAASEEGDVQQISLPKKNEIRNKKLKPDFQRYNRREHFSVSNQIGFIEELPKEEQARFTKLYKENPMKFNHAVSQYIMQQHRENIESCKKLRKEYLDAVGTDKEEKAKTALREELTRQIQKNLKDTEKQLKRSQQQLEAAQKRLDHFRKEYEKRKQNESQLIEKALRGWCDPDFVLPELKFKRNVPNESDKDIRINSR